ncbi:hypothetical protein SESBI_37268 [Sesbania bispinosa]|nr:hypothetical protein SESBI_37268 [Sesbania bispinosa]
MAKVATPNSVPPSSHRLPLKDGTMAKRKTPSELRGEQLKRASAVDLTDQSPPPLAGSTNSSGLSAAIDMGKALIGLAAPEPRVNNGLAADSSEICGDLTSTMKGNFFSECHVPGQKAPLDLTLKTNMRIVSSSLNW